MPFKGLLTNRSKAKKQEPREDLIDSTDLTFRFMRSDTHTQEIITPLSLEPESWRTESLKRPSHFRSLSTTSSTSKETRKEKRLAALLTLRPSASNTRRSSINVPADLPNIDDTADGGEKEAQWEKRATMLANGNTKTNWKSPTNLQPADTILSPMLEAARRLTETSRISDGKGDV